MIRKTKGIKTEGMGKDEKGESWQQGVKELDLRLLWRIEQLMICPNSQSFWASDSCSLYYREGPTTWWEERSRVGLSSYTDEEQQEKIWDWERHTDPASPERQQ